MMQFVLDVCLELCEPFQLAIDPFRNDFLLKWLPQLACIQSSVVQNYRGPLEEKMQGLDKTFSIFYLPWC
jgi:hypothetical protein